MGGPPVSVNFFSLFVVILLLAFLFFIVKALTKAPKPDGRPRICPSCATPLPPHARFCGRCGRAL